MTKCNFSKYEMLRVHSACHAQIQVGDCSPIENDEQNRGPLNLNVFEESQDLEEAQTNPQRAVNRLRWRRLYDKLEHKPKNNQ